MSTSATLPLLASLPALVLLPLPVLALAFFTLTLLSPRAPAPTNEHRFSLLGTADEKQLGQTAANTNGLLRPGSYASRHTTVRTPAAKGVKLGGAAMRVVLPSVGAGMCFGAAAICELAAAAGAESADGGLARASDVLSTLGVFLAGAVPIVLLTPRALLHIFPSCATLQPTRRVAHSRTATPEPYKLRRSSYRVGILFLALAASSIWTLLAAVLAPAVSVPSAVVALGPALQMLALLLPLPSILHLSPHRPILIPTLFGIFFGLVSRAFPLALAFEPAASALGSALRIAGAVCELLWVTILLLTTTVLAATQPRNASPVPGFYPSPAHLALLHAALDNAPRPAPSSKTTAPGSPKTSTNSSVLDITALPASDNKRPSMSDLPSYDSSPESDMQQHQQLSEVELNDPTALLRAAILRSFDSPGQASTYESIRSTLPADFTLALQAYSYSPELNGASHAASFRNSMPAPPVPALPIHTHNTTPSRPRTAGATASIRKTLSRLGMRSPARPKTAPASRAQHADSEGDCTCELPASRLTPPERFGFESSDAALAMEREREWVTDLEASPRQRAEEPVAVRFPTPREGVRVEVDVESDAYESAEEGKGEKA